MCFEDPWSVQDVRCQKILTVGHLVKEVLLLYCVLPTLQLFHGLIVTKQISLSSQ